MKRVLGFLLVLLVAGVAFGFVWASKNAPNEHQDYLVKISTSKGDMYAVLYPETPKHRANFIKLVKAKYYDGLLFHRIIPEFMVQGGDPESRDASKSTDLGTGGPGYTIPAEVVSGLYHFKGTLCAARMGDEVNPRKESSGSQFYITQGKTYDSLTIAQMGYQKKQVGLNQLFSKYISNPSNADFVQQMRDFQQKGQQQKVDSLYHTIEPLLNEAYKLKGGVDYDAKAIERYVNEGGTPFLDGEYTVFGEVVKGLEIVDELAVVKTNSRNRPNKDISMTISYEILSKKEITKRTGYKY